MLIQNQNLYPLSYLYPSLIDYYMDGEGAIYSQKRGTLSRLFGTQTSSGRYYTLNKNSWRGIDLLHAAQRDSRFGTETKTVITAKSIGIELPTEIRNHAGSLDAGLKAKGFIIGTMQGASISFAKEPTVHTTETSVKNEAERLARLQPGTKFVIAKICNVVMAGGVSWE